MYTPLMCLPSEGIIDLDFAPAFNQLSVSLSWPIMQTCYGSQGSPGGQYACNHITVNMLIVCILMNYRKLYVAEHK
jgi:hypothetical protein